MKYEVCKENQAQIVCVAYIVHAFQVVEGNCFDGNGVGIMLIVVDGDGNELLARSKL